MGCGPLLVITVLLPIPPPPQERRPEREPEPESHRDEPESQRDEPECQGDCQPRNISGGPNAYASACAGGRLPGGRTLVCRPCKHLQALAVPVSIPPDKRAHCRAPLPSPGSLRPSSPKALEARLAEPTVSTGCLQLAPCCPLATNGPDAAGSQSATSTRSVGRPSTGRAVGGVGFGVGQIRQEVFWCVYAF